MTQTPMSSFFTREKANAGLDFPLWLPDGTKSEHSLRIRGMDSDEFREAEQQSQREMAENAGNPQELIEVYTRWKLRLIASLIISWTFPEECNLENKLKFLKEAPQIADAINRVGSNRKLFFGRGSSNSSNTQSVSSDSTVSQKGQSNPSVQASNKSSKPQVKNPNNSKSRKRRRS